MTKQGIPDVEGRVRISESAHIVFDLHLLVDELEEQARGRYVIGTTKRGIGPTYACKVARRGLRVADLVGDWDVFCERYCALVDFYKIHYPNLNLDVKTSLEVCFPNLFTLINSKFLLCRIFCRKLLATAIAWCPWSGIPLS